MSLESRLEDARAVLARIEKDFLPARLACSYGAEDMVLFDLIAREFPSIGIFTLDTGRLPRETEELHERAQRHYGVRVDAFAPDPDAVRAWVAQHGPDGFYESLENRLGCCRVRKVEPLGRALKGHRAWITGLRRAQSVTRAEVKTREFDHVHALFKFNPLADWSEAEVWSYLQAHDVPVNALHGRGYPSIGCEPCTRAVRAGEDPRAGRWWWELRDTKECGLHPVAPAAPRVAGIAR